MSLSLDASLDPSSAAVSVHPNIASSPLRHRRSNTRRLAAPLPNTSLTQGASFDAWLARTGQDHDEYTAPSLPPATAAASSYVDPAASYADPLHALMENPTTSSLEALLAACEYRPPAADEPAVADPNNKTARRSGARGRREEEEQKESSEFNMVEWTAEELSLDEELAKVLEEEAALNARRQRREEELSAQHHAWETLKMATDRALREADDDDGMAMGQGRKPPDSREEWAEWHARRAIEERRREVNHNTHRRRDVGRENDRVADLSRTNDLYDETDRVRAALLGEAEDWETNIRRTDVLPHTPAATWNRATGEYDVVWQPLEKRGGLGWVGWLGGGRPCPVE